MNVKKIKSNKFESFEIQLTIESKEEAQALYAIFNKGSNSTLLPEARDIRLAIGKEYYVEDSYAIIANGVKYMEYYK